ncbi:hypothetical protein ILYODFUR_010859 [Ilyodon furcidens]|uniref:Ig-like domain-containing protein n=1 Tax=Ilyodon furcidens TaxID=33524 RepID=A0ABV0SN53_9TELE
MNMRCVQVSAILLFALSGFQQQAAPLPASTILVRAGEDAVLQCPLLDGSNGTTASLAPGPATLSWYRKAAGHRPTLLLSLTPANGSIVSLTEIPENSRINNISEKISCYSPTDRTNGRFDPRAVCLLWRLLLFCSDGF